MRELATKYGLLRGVAWIRYYSEGPVAECMVDAHNEINTPYGRLVPQFEDDGVRRKYTKSLSFYENGNLKSIVLQEQMDMKTICGTMPAEQIVFYESGNIKRIFPLNGKITGYWTEEDEYSLAKEFTFELSFGRICQKIIGTYFYDDGGVKSITFWPQARFSLQTPIGRLENRIGISLYPDGKLKSCEPAEPVAVDTPIGEILAYNMNAIGIHGDNNSLSFDKTGKVKSLITSHNIVEAVDAEGNHIQFEPYLRPSLFNPEAMEVLPCHIEFDDNKVTFNEKFELDISKYTFTIKPFDRKCGGCRSNCSRCNGCG